MEAEATPNSEGVVAPTESATMAEIGGIIGASRDMGQVYEEFSRAVSRLVPFDRLRLTPWTWTTRR